MLNIKIAIAAGISKESLHYKTNIAPISETDTNMKEILLLHNITDLDLTIIHKIHAKNSSIYRSSK